MRFADFTITPTGELLRDGAPVHLQPQPMKVLTLLASRAGELVTREEIQQHVWTDAVVDFDQGLNWCIRRIREVLGDDASAPRFIQTVPRRGYRFIAEIKEPSPPPARRWRIAIASVVLALLVSGVQFSVPRRVSVLVIPFDHLGGGSAHAEEVATEEVIASLARIDPQRLGVIDRLTAMKFKETKECVVELGRQLDTEYVLLGAVRRRGERLRVTAQLFRVADNQQAWAAVRELPANADPAATYARMAGEMAAKLGIVPRNAAVPGG